MEKFWKIRKEKEGEPGDYVWCPDSKSLSAVIRAIY